MEEEKRTFRIFRISLEVCFIGFDKKRHTAYSQMYFLSALTKTSHDIVNMLFLHHKMRLVVITSNMNKKNLYITVKSITLLLC